MRQLREAALLQQLSGGPQPRRPSIRLRCWGVDRNMLDMQGLNTLLPGGQLKLCWSSHRQLHVHGKPATGLVPTTASQRPLGCSRPHTCSSESAAASSAVSCSGAASEASTALKWVQAAE